MHFNKFILALLLFIICCRISEAQVIEATVSSNTDQLASDYKDKLTQFNTQIQNYINQNQNQFITNTQNSKLKIKLEMQFLFRSGSGFDNYDAQIVVASQRQVCPDRNCLYNEEKFTRALIISDDRCSFNYSNTMPFVRNDSRFDPLLSLVDYYVYVVLGYDEDSYIPKGGSRYFQKALDICSRTLSGAKGWTETGGGSKPSRLQFVQELLNTRFDNFRKAYFEYMWMGVDSMLVDSRNAQQNILNALDKMAKVKKGEVRAYTIDLFFENKSTEIADLFVTYPDKTVYDRIMQIDPTHRSVYEEAKRRVR